MNLIKSITKRPLNFFRHVSSSDSAHSNRTAATDVEKRVSFADNATTSHDTIARRNISREEIKAAWYSEEEYRIISRQCSKQIHKMDRGEILKDRKYCARGLEAHTRMRSIAKSKNRAQSIRSVMLEQEIQIKEAAADDEAISQVYNETTSSCQMWASVIGLQDQRAAEEYLDDDDIEIQRLSQAAAHQPTYTRVLQSHKTVPRRKRFIISARSA